MLTWTDPVIAEAKMVQNEMELHKMPKAEIDKKIGEFIAVRSKEAVFVAQKGYLDSFLSIITCDDNGVLANADQFVDYYKLPEYIYCGPDENCSNELIQWLAYTSREVFHNKAGSAFISGKSPVGVNHKDFGVTSEGVNENLQAVVQKLGLKKYTVKITGGPDGDVAGNMMHILAERYPQAALITVITDGSGTIYDPVGLEWEPLMACFHHEKMVNHYPAAKLHVGGFQLDVTQTKTDGFTKLMKYNEMTAEGLKENWIPASEGYQLYRTNAHTKKSDIFLPCGGRPRTLNENTWKEFLDAEGKPTSRVIVEGDRKSVV